MGTTLTTWIFATSMLSTCRLLIPISCMYHIAINSRCPSYHLKSMNIWIISSLDEFFTSLCKVQWHLWYGKCTSHFPTCIHRVYFKKYTISSSWMNPFPQLSTNCRKLRFCSRGWTSWLQLGIAARGSLPGKLCLVRTSNFTQVEMRS